MKPDQQTHTNTESELAAAWQDGDREAGTRLLRRYVHLLDRYFHTKVGADEAEDLRQETLIRVMHAIPGFRFESSVRTYIYRVAYLTLCDRLRYRQSGRGRRDAAQCSLEELHGVIPTSDTLDQSGRDLVNALRMLAIEDQMLIELIYIEGLSYAEAAAALATDCALSTLRARVHAIKQRLRVLLAERDETERSSFTQRAPSAWCLDAELRQLQFQLDGIVFATSNTPGWAETHGPPRFTARGD